MIITGAPVAFGTSYPPPPLTEEEMTEVVNIARADPQIKELVDQGATMGEVIGCFTAGFVTSTDGNMITMSTPSKVKALVSVELGEKSWSVQVDLKKKEVTDVVPTFIELTEAEKGEVVSIARADPRVKELLDMGAMIGRVSPMFSFGNRINAETGETEEFSGTMVRVEIEWVEKNYIAHVDLTEGKVVRFLETTSGVHHSYSGTEGEFKIEHFKIEAPIEEAVKP